MLRILKMMLVMITVSNAHKSLYNDICATVSKSNESSRVARVECHPDSVRFDPNHQNGAFLFNNETGSWTGEIFACQCSCSLPNKPQDGWILTNSRLQHGKSLEYKCDSKTEHARKIICLDGFLMMVPDALDDYNISTAFRQKSLPGGFINNFQNAIFKLSVNEDWSVHKSEVSNNQKYTDILTEKDTTLKYYLLNGEDFKLGTIELNKVLELECSTRRFEPDLSATVIIVSSLFALAFISIVYVLIYRFRKQIQISLIWPSSTDPFNKEQGPIVDRVPGKKGNGHMELTEKEKKYQNNPGNPLLHVPKPFEETPDTADRSNCPFSDIQTNKEQSLTLYDQ